MKNTDDKNTTGLWRVYKRFWIWSSDLKAVKLEEKIKEWRKRGMQVKSRWKVGIFCDDEIRGSRFEKGWYEKWLYAFIKDLKSFMNKDKKWRSLYGEVGAEKTFAKCLY